MDMADGFAVVLVLAVAAAAVLAYGPGIWCLVDAARTPEWAWASTGRSKAGWVAVFVIGILVWFVGIIGAIVYLTTVRPQLQRATRDGAARGLTVPASGSKVAWIVVGFVGALWLAGLWTYVTAHGP